MTVPLETAPAPETRVLTRGQLRLVLELLNRERAALARLNHHDPIMRAYVEQRLLLVDETLARLQQEPQA